MQALLLSHKRKDVRDTAKYPPFMKPQVSSISKFRVCCPVGVVAAVGVPCSYYRCSPSFKCTALQARTGKLKPRALRHLASEMLGLTIQEGEHSPVDDARAALYLYLKHRKVKLHLIAGLS